MMKVIAGKPRSAQGRAAGSYTEGSSKFCMEEVLTAKRAKDRQNEESQIHKKLYVAWEIFNHKRQASCRIKMKIKTKVVHKSF